MADGTMGTQQKKTWVKPELKHMRAGSAENNPPGAGVDNPNKIS